MSFFSNKLLLNILTCGLILSSPLPGELFAASHEQENMTQPKAKQDWSQFTSTEDGFSIDLPSSPEHVSQTITIPNTDLKISYDTFISEPNDSTVYVISVWDYFRGFPQFFLQFSFGSPMQRHTRRL